MKTTQKHTVRITHPDDLPQVGPSRQANALSMMLFGPSIAEMAEAILAEKKDKEAPRET